MRPIKLKIKNLNSFIEEQVIDFEKLTSRGLFGIFGPTGSGKSTILDGITLALYGNVARKSSNYINTNSDKMSVSFEFEIRGASTRRYIVDREFKRNTKGSINAGKCKLVDTTVEDNIEVLADATKVLNKKIEEIIGLNLEDFTRTVVLPQGKFSEFLKLEGKERREMLERLFNLQKYGDELAFKLSSNIAKERQENSVLLGELKGYEDISEERLKEKNNELQETNIKLEKVKSELADIEKRYKESEELWKLQLELLKYEEEKNKLEVRKEEIKTYEEKIKYGEAALRIYPYVKGFEDTKEKIKANKEALEKYKNQMTELEIRKKELEEKWKKAKQDMESMIPQLSVKEQKISKAIVEKNKLKEILNTINRLSFEIKDLENRIASNEEILINVEKSLKEKEGLVNELDTKYDQLKIDEDLKVKVQDGVLLEENKENLIKDIKRYENKKKEKLEEKDNIVATGVKLKESYEKVTEDLKKEESALEELVKKCPGEQKDLLDLNKEISESEHKLKFYEKYDSEIKSYKKECDSFEEKIIKNKEKLTLFEKQSIELKKKFDEANKEELAKQLREELNDGEVCPVCGSIHHNKENLVIKSDINSQEINKEINDKNDEIKDLIAEITKDETKVNALKENIKNNENEIKDLGTNYTEQSLKELKLKLENLEKSIDEYNKNKEELEKAINDLRVNQKDKDGDLKAFREKYKAVEYELKNTEKDLKDSNEKMNVIDDKLSLLQNETSIVNFKEKNKEIREIEIKRSKIFNELKENRNGLKKLQEEKENKNKDIVLFKDALTKNKTEISGLEKNKEEKISFIKEEVGTLENLEDLLSQVKKNIESINLIYSRVEKEKIIQEEEFLKCKERLDTSQSASKELEERIKSETINLNKALQKEQFKDIEAVKENLLESEVLQEHKKQVEEYKLLLSKIEGTIDSLKIKINNKEITKEEFESIANLREEKTKEQTSVNEERVRILEEVKNIETKLKEQKELLDKKKKLDYKLSLLSDLEKLFKGKKFVEFVASHQLKYVSIEASKRLKEITHGNYGLEVDEDGRFIIRDYKNGGAERDASTLSGGETFLASLSLALALSAQIQLKGTAPLEFFFLDEGFGTLDDELLEVVMNSLERIHNDKLKIGIISHVESIKNRVPIKLIVTPAQSGKGGSKAKIEKS